MTEIVVQEPGVRLQASLGTFKRRIDSFPGRIIDRKKNLHPVEISEISHLSMLFLKLFRESGITATQPTSLNVVLPGGSYSEIVGAHLAASTLGVPRTNITNINLKLLSDKDSLKRVFLQEGEETDGAMTMQVGSTNIRLQVGDASLPTNKEHLPPADATMVFVGNCQVGMKDVVANWATFGTETGKPFVLAVTATNEEGERQQVKTMFDQAKERGDLSTVNGMEGTENPFKFNFPGAFGHARITNHDYLFVAASQ